MKTNPINPRFLLEQGPMLKTLGQVALATATGKIGSEKPTTPGKKFAATLQPRSNELIDAYAEWSGASPSEYANEVPPHLFPQWSFPLASAAIADIPYKLTGVLNQGAAMQINAPIPRDVPLRVEAWLEDLQDDGYKARLHQRVVTHTPDAENALIADIFAVVVLKRKKSASTEKPAEPDWNTVDTWKADLNDGLRFAFLTGDFNPIHWIGPYAKIAGFKRQILHGFGSFARSFESAKRELGSAPREIDVRFIKPLVLPATADVLLAKEGKKNQYKIAIQDGSGAKNMVGSLKL